MSTPWQMRTLAVCTSTAVTFMARRRPALFSGLFKGLPPRDPAPSWRICMTRPSLRDQAIMPGRTSRARRPPPPIQYRDRQDRVWSVSEVAVLKVVSPAIDGPNVALVIRFEREGEERLARWTGDTDWREAGALRRLFESADAQPDDAGVGPAPAETVQLWVELVATMGPDELADFEARTFRHWDRASLSAVRVAIDRRRRELHDQP